MAHSSKQFLWKIGAPAGYGVMTTGLSMSKIAARSGLHIFDYTEYPSLIQGGHNTYEVNISTEHVTMTKDAVDCLVCLTPDTYALHEHRLHEDSIIVFDPSQGDPDMNGLKVAVPFQEILNQLKASKIMLNMISFSASVAILGGKLEMINDMIKQQFAKKEPEVTEMNIACATAGFNYVIEHYADKVVPIISAAQPPAVSPAILDANTAFSLGAVEADCRFYAAYPMSPSSTVIEILASWQSKTGMVVRHAEDEIGVVNEALGASFAGVRSAVGTSGGGFALMAETVSYAGVAEQPIVIFVAQRPGPATGMPTWTEQGDLLFAIHAGHGEFPKIVIAPGDAEEMLELTPKAFNLADIYQTPVIVLSDKLISEAHKDIPQDKVATLLKTHTVYRGETMASTEAPYYRYQDQEDGISPRLIPGHPGMYYQSNSYEHYSDSHTTEESADRIAQVNKRARKIDTYFRRNWSPPTVYGDIDAAEVIFVSWGGTKGAVQAAQILLGQQDRHNAFIHFTHVFPLKADDITPLFKSGKRYILVENNSTGQFGQVLRAATGIDLQERLLKYDGRPIFAEEIVAFVDR
ncbi:MAG: 2-oxoglutarate/2-oxoacid ferredoxin oxidoreductase subunit alpha [Patescibacteria group bacterium]|nr:2-oxoglutarate/2-oxoacid ferredoxin oxidoreductase subunit alpha [Patescibacteria group bacterium]